MIPLTLLTAGQLLYHGTCATLEFQIPNGPAWFAWDPSAAAYWTGPAWAKARRPVVKVYQALLDVELLDVTERSDWEALGDLLHVEEHSYLMARAVAARGYAGWLAKTEVLLCDPAAALGLTGQIVLDAP